MQGLLYSRDEGCIGKAWERGKFIVESLPDPENKSAYIQDQVERCFISQERAENLNMKCRSYAGFSIKDISDNTIGVLLLESLNKKIKPDLRNGLKQEAAKISPLLMELQHHIPKIDIAQSEGF